MKFRDFSLAEEKNDTAVMTFGRFQPITSAHETLIKQVGSLAKEKGAHPFVFTSRKSGDKKNPLDFNTKSDMLRKHYGVNVPDSEEINNPFQAAQHLGKLGYKNVHLVLGGDRVKDIGGMIKKYMGHEDPEKRMNISNLTLRSAGERDANPVSGTAVRAAARSGNVKEFQRMIAPSLGKESTETIYRVLRGEQQLGESLDKPFPTTYKTRTISGRKRHYYNFEVPPRKPESKIDKLSDPKKGTIEFLPAVDASGNPTKKGHVELSFDIDGDMHTTGGGSAGGVFSTVKSAVKDFMKNNPDTKVLKANIMPGDQYKRDLDDNVVTDKDGKPVFSGRAKLYKRLGNYFGKEYGFDVDVDMDGGYFKATRKIDESLDKPFPITYRSKEKLDGGKRHYFDFEVPPIDTKSRLPQLSKPTKGKVEFNPSRLSSREAAKKGHYEVSFDVGGETKTTGKGNAGRILSTVKSAVKQFMKMKPDAKSFNAIIIDSDQFKKDSDGNIVKDKDGKFIPSGRAKLYKRLANHFAKEYGFDVDINMKQGRFRGTRKGETPVDTSSSIPANLRPSSAFAESLDNPFPTTYTKDRLYGDIEHHYGFEIPAEGEQKKVKKGKVMFSQAFGRGRGHYDLAFDVDDQSTPTGAGNTTKIFSTVLSAVDQHMKKYPKTKGIEALIPADLEHKRDDRTGEIIRDESGKPVRSGRSKLYTRLANQLGKKYGFDVEVDADGGGFRGTRKKAPKLAEEVKRDPNRTGPRTGLGSTKFIGVPDPKTGKIKIRHVFANEPLPDDIKKALQKEEANPRIPRKEGQPAKSKKHSDLYTDEDPKGTIHGLGFKNASVARASVKKIESSSRSHAHKIQAAVAMEQRARVANKDAAAAIYRRYIDRNKKSD